MSEIRAPFVGRTACRLVILTGALWLAWASSALAIELVETPMFIDVVAAGQLPSVDQRVPNGPKIVQMSGYKSPGVHGGELSMLIGRAKDVRLLVVYGYARLVAYNEDFELEPDILEAVDVDEGRVFTLHLRPGHKWSDGHPFTAEDLRYYWEDVANDPGLSPSGPPRTLLVDGQQPVFEVLDETTVRYSWHKPNPFFLPALAQATPLFIYRPAHVMKQFHRAYTDEDSLQALVEAEDQRDWIALHFRKDRLYKFDSPALPTLQPWRNTTAPPATRFVAERNPYYHRVDERGQQLPYIDRFILTQANSKLIPAKAGAGEADLQSRHIFFNNFTFLKANEERNNYVTHLWQTAKGSHFTLFPNLNVNDPAWRTLLRDVRFRRALSLAIDRTLINQVIYFGLAIEGNNTVLPKSPLFREDYQTRWARYDIDAANRLLDEIGLERRPDGIRQLPDGRELDIIVETAGEDTEQTDVLELIQETWREAGIRLYTRPSQREVFRNRIFSGETMMSVWSGFENGIPTAAMSPAELAPTSQQQLQWPKWGQYFETSGGAGEAPDIPSARELGELNQAWLETITRETREKVWHRMLEIHADEVFTVGVISGVRQPVIVRTTLKNVPHDAVYNWEPGAQFGVYRPDTFWFGEAS